MCNKNEIIDKDGLLRSTRNVRLRDKIIRYWATKVQTELNCFTSLEQTIQIHIHLANNGMFEFEELEDRKGMLAYFISFDCKGKKYLNEMFMYICPQFRGNIRLFKGMIKRFEDLAQANDCEYVTIGSNIGYKDEVVLKLLGHWGYKHDTLKKEF